MASERNALRAGLFMVISAGLVVAAIVAIAGYDRLFAKWQQRTAVFQLGDDLGGLRAGDEVRLGGIKVGQITRIEIRQAEGTATTQAGARIAVEFGIPQQYILRQGARVRVQSLVTGTSLLNIDDLGSGAALAEGAELVGRPSMFAEIGVALEQLTPQVQQIVGEIRTTSVPRLNEALAGMKTTTEGFSQAAKGASELIAHVDKKIDPAIDRYNAVADRSAEMMTQVRDVVGESKGDIRGTAANLRAATGSLKEKIPPLLAKVDDILVQVDKAMVGVNTTLADVQATVNSAKEAAGAARSIVAGNRTRLDAMVVSLKATSDNLKAASVEIRRSPWRLLYKPAAGEMANLNIYDSARQFSEGATALSDAAGALRDAIKDPSADKKQIEQLMDQVNKSFGNFSQAEKKLWDSVKE